MSILKAVLLLSATLALSAQHVQAEILALMNYETKSADSLKSLKLSGIQARQEAIAIMDVDPQSPQLGKILWEMPLPNDLVAHHIFYDRTMTKAYITSLAKEELNVLDMTTSPYRRKTIAVPNCKMGEDVIFNEDNTRWFLTCMNSGNAFVGEVATDKIVGAIDLAGTYPHGLAINSGINRILVTSTIKGDLTSPDEVISVVDATTLKAVGKLKMSDKPTPSGVAPVEILFVPGAEPPVAYITNMFGNTLWTATWNANRHDFDTRQVYDFASEDAKVPLEMYFSSDANKLYVSTAAPGKLHVFDIAANKGQPQHTKTLATAEGAHHIAFTKDGKYAFVQNSFINLPGMSSGLITVIDLKTETVTATVDSLANAGFNPNSIVLLPQWNHFAGH